VLFLGLLVVGFDTAHSFAASIFNIGVIAFTINGIGGI
jgi:hypothetical protein